jgi:hypothetical protein
MTAILPQAQVLVSKLVNLVPICYQQDSLQALLGLFLKGQKNSLPKCRRLAGLLRDILQGVCPQVLVFPKTN